VVFKNMPPALSPAHIALGSLSFTLKVGTSTASKEYQPLTTRWLHSGIFNEDHESTIETLLFLLGDGIGFGGEVSTTPEIAIVRVWMIPRDTAPWSRRSSSRGRYLKRLFYDLKKGWDGDGENLMSMNV
jgi:hypothetical protein